MEAIGGSEDGTGPVIERGTRQPGERVDRRRTRQARAEAQEQVRRQPERRRPVRLEETHVAPVLAGTLGVDFPNFDYPREFREAALSGLVVVQCIVTERGDVRGCRVRSGPEALAEYVISILAQWRYEPGRDHNDEAVAVAKTYRVPFRLN
ncbi:MAG: hypothetical protein EA398_12705 [Deltaproteobacteria bacterium]|nr:MAG: hypothetical protein EA398_12705 [Deltaproteobacteria bacterium]